jgi:hypothetical protein
VCIVWYITAGAVHAGQVRVIVRLMRSCHGT